MFEYISNTANRRTLGVAYPFCIYNDEIYIITSTSGNFNVVNLFVYSFKGEVVRSNILININPTSATLTQYYYPHWMSIFGGKLIVTPTGTPASSYANQWKVLRFDTKTLLLEDVKLLPINPTDDNTITKNGTLYLNGEGAPSVSYLMKMNYKNFSTYSEELTNYSSTGSLNSAHNIQKESLKTNLSDFANDIGLIKTLQCDINDSTTLTGTTTETILKSYFIAANDIASGMININALFEAMGTANTTTVKIYKNTTAGLTGASQIALVTKANTTLTQILQREFTLKSNNTLVGWNASSSVGIPTGTSGAATTATAFNPAVANYIIITAQLASTSDSITQKSFEMIYKKA